VYICLSYGKLSLCRPDILQQSITLSQSVEAIVALCARPNVSTQRVRDVLSSVSSLVVNFAHVDLNRAVVVRLDDTASRRALSGDVEVDKLASVMDC